MANVSSAFQNAATTESQTLLQGATMTALTVSSMSQNHVLSSPVAEAGFPVLPVGITIAVLLLAAVFIWWWRQRQWQARRKVTQMKTTSAVVTVANPVNAFNNKVTPADDVAPVTNPNYGRVAKPALNHIPSVSNNFTGQAGRSSAFHAQSSVLSVIPTTSKSKVAFSATEITS
jgi:hypothetical protein